MAYKEAIQKVGIDESDVIDWRDAKFYGCNGEDAINYPGYIILTKDKLIFVSKKGFFRSVRKRYEVEVSQIKKISKLPLMKQFVIYANTTKEGAGFLKKLFKSKNAQIYMKEGKSFVEKIKEVNPRIE